MHAPTTRRTVLAAAATTAAVLAAAGCSKYGEGDGGANEPPPAKAPVTPPASGGQPAAKPAPLAATADIPVGGGKIFKDEKVVVTQPESGSFKAFSAVCTHQGCTVADVTGGTINCPCHGSKYRVADASVAGGPAPSPLPPRAITVENGSIRLS
ncbi:iron-sulfur protein [Streptomyces spiroverticillatus]|uniref:Cytochrome bc1 complex Rieske iron-sulfur subunit n=1 Tax=Streptomyces finlayi TaxID=67296 RepID=A0A918X1H7_9ACTN|nr:Rieske (2Fe-2S) protein [Streptomyces finlayi]GHA36659.1 iron-sulfur protein [Streptomyces spiroverticillatus]GHD01872.1 iron-sulfur protein [Streptomyces finlayi]